MTVRKSERWFGPCACCPRVTDLLIHHCHLRDGIRAATQVVLVPKTGWMATKRLFRQHREWARDPRIVALVRFGSARVCETCNVVDAVARSLRPGRRFSLWPGEIAGVRSAAGHADDKGWAFLAALATAREHARPDHLARFPAAQPLGVALAWEWLDGPGIRRSGVLLDWEDSIAEAERDLWYLVRDYRKDRLPGRRSRCA